MANPLKGAVSFKIDGAPYSLSFSAEALYRLEEALGMSTRAIAAVLQDPEQHSAKLTRTLFWAGMLDDMPDLMLNDIGPYYRRINPIEATMLVSRAFMGAFIDPKAVDPKAVEPAAGDKPADPP